MLSRKKLGFLFTCLSLLALLLSACGGTTAPTTSNKAPDDKQVLRYPVVGDPDIKTMDPALVQDTDSNFPIQAVFTGLVSLDANLKVQKQLADSWQVSDDQKTYTFKLKPNLTFSDGSPLTSKDVVYSINRAVLKATNSPVSYYLSLLQDYDKASNGTVPTLIGDSLLTPDDNTVVIKISQPAAYFLQTLSYPTSYVVKQSIVEKYGAKFTDHLDEGAGAGPFKVESYSHTTGLQLVRNDKYYGPKAALARLTIPFYQDQDGMYRAYQANQLDFTPVPTTNLASERGKKGFNDINRLTIRYLTMNYLAKPFDNIKIRQAFALALDKDLIVKTSLHGAYQATNHIIPQGMDGYYAGLKGPDGTTGLSGNPTLAKQLLTDGEKEAGYTTLPDITLTYYPREASYQDAVAQMQQQWSDNLGVKVNVNVVTRPKLLDLEVSTENNTGPLQMWIAGWNSDYPDPQDWLTTFFDTTAVSQYNQFNYGQNKSANASEEQDVQKQLEQADITSDPTKRIQLYNDAEQKIVNDVGWVSLWQERVQSLTKANVKNLTINAQLQIPPDDWSKIYITQ